MIFAEYLHNKNTCNFSAFGVFIFYFYVYLLILTLKIRITVANSGKCSIDYELSVSKRLINIFISTIPCSPAPLMSAIKPNTQRSQNTRTVAGVNGVSLKTATGIVHGYDRDFNYEWLASGRVYKNCNVSKRFSVMRLGEWF